MSETYWSTDNHESIFGKILRHPRLFFSFYAICWSNIVCTFACIRYKKAWYRVLYAFYLKKKILFKFKIKV